MPQHTQVRCLFQGFDVNARQRRNSSTAFLLKGQHPGARGFQRSDPNVYAALWKRFQCWEPERQLSVGLGQGGPTEPDGFPLAVGRGNMRMPGTAEEMPVIVWIAVGRGQPGRKPQGQARERARAQETAPAESVARVPLTHSFLLTAQGGPGESSAFRRAVKPGRSSGAERAPGAGAVGGFSARGAAWDRRDGGWRWPRRQRRPVAQVCA